MGFGILNCVAATPIPFWHVLGGNVVDPKFPAAQNITPAMPDVVPAAAGFTVSIKLAAAACWDWLKGPTQFGIGWCDSR